MGFDGVVISDDMQMGAIVETHGLTVAVVEAIKAGVDMILLANQIGEYNIDSGVRCKKCHCTGGSRWLY